MTRRTILPVAGLLLLTASLSYAAIRLLGILSMGWLWFLPWLETLLLSLVAWVGSFMIRFGPEHSRQTARNGLAGVTAGLGMIGIGILAVTSFRLPGFFGCFAYLAYVLWWITGLGLVGVGSILSITAAVKGFFSEPPAEPGHCSVCGYNLMGLPRRRCPECGTPF
jgi:hypothetical protein